MDRTYLVYVMSTDESVAGTFVACNTFNKSLADSWIGCHDVEKATVYYKTEVWENGSYQHQYFSKQLEEK